MHIWISKTKMPKYQFTKIIFIWKHSPYQRAKFPYPKKQFKLNILKIDRILNRTIKIIRQTKNKRHLQKMIKNRLLILIALKSHFVLVINNLFRNKLFLTLNKGKLNLINLCWIKTFLSRKWSWQNLKWQKCRKNPI